MIQNDRGYIQLLCVYIRSYWRFHWNGLFSSKYSNFCYNTAVININIFYIVEI